MISSYDSIKVYNCITQEVIVKASVSYVMNAKFSPLSNKFLAIKDGVMKIWNLPSGECIYASDIKTNSSSFNSAGDKVLCIDNSRWKNNSVWILDLANEYDKKVLVKDTVIINSAEFTPNNKMIVVQRDNMYNVKYPDRQGYSTEYKTITSFFDIESLKEVYVINDTTQAKIHFNPNKKQFIYCSGSTFGYTKVLTFYNIETFKKTAQIDVKSSFLEFNSLGDRLISGINYDIFLLDTYTGKIISKLNNIHGFPNKFRFSKNGKRVISSDGYGDLNIWDSSNGRKTNQLDENSGWFRCEELGKDGRYIFTFSDGNILLRDLDNNNILCSFNGYYNVISHPDGKSAILEDDEKYILWEFMPLDKLVEDSKSYLKNRTFTTKEQRHYFME